MKKIMINGENVLNVPNMLSFYRLIISPVILYFILTGNETWFAILICISLVSDALDGNIARTFNLQTKFGAALDNVGDFASYVMAVLGVLVFKWAAIEPHVWILYLYILVWTISYIIAFYQFGKIPGLHLYTPVIAGYLQGIFLFVLFAFDFYAWLYYLAVGLGVIAYIEKCFVLMRLDDIRSGVKGLYWLVQKQKQER